MLAHKLKHLVEVWRHVQAKDSIGSISETEQLVDTVYMDKQDAIGRAVANDDRVLNQTESTFILRHYPTITYEHFFKYQGQSYRVHAIGQLPDGSGQLIKTVRNG